MQKTNGSLGLPARTRTLRQAALFRRPFAPGSIGFRAMMKVPYNGDPHGGAHVAAYFGAQSVLQRLERPSCRAAGAWSSSCSRPVPRRREEAANMNCRLIVTLPVRPGGRRGGGHLRGRRRARGGLAGRSESALLRRAQAGRRRGRHRRLPVHRANNGRCYRSVPKTARSEVQTRPGGEDLLVLSPATEEWLRACYARQMSAEAVRHDLGEDPQPRRTRVRHRAGRGGRGAGPVAGGGVLGRRARHVADQAGSGACARGRVRSHRPRARGTTLCTSTSAAPGRTRRSQIGDHGFKRCMPPASNHCIAGAVHVPEHLGCGGREPGVSIASELAAGPPLAGRPGGARTEDNE